MRAQWRKWSWPLRRGRTKTRNWGLSFQTIRRSKPITDRVHWLTSWSNFRCSLKVLTNKTTCGFNWSLSQFFDEFVPWKKSFLRSAVSMKRLNHEASILKKFHVFKPGSWSRSWIWMTSSRKCMWLLRCRISTTCWWSWMQSTHCWAS